MNAVTHGDAASIHISLDYTREALVVRVKDDGIGMDPKVVREGRPGHWGLKGMHERAQELGGILEIDGSVGHGGPSSRSHGRGRDLPIGAARPCARGRPLVREPGVT